MNTRELENIFDTTANRMDGLDISTIRPIWDRVLVEDIPDANLILLPHEKERGAGRDGMLRIGRIAAVGPGDPNKELGMSACGNYVRRKRRVVRMPMEVVVGDLVLYDRRKEAEIFVNGTRYGLMYAEQAVIMVLPPGTKYDGVGGLKLP